MTVCSVVLCVCCRSVLLVILIGGLSLVHGLSSCEELGWVLFGARRLCDGNMWGESGRVGCIRSRV